VISQDVEQEYAITREARRSRMSPPWKLALGVGLAIYAAVYVAAEIIVHDTSLKNRLFMINTAPQAEYDYVIVGASHAMPFGFEDMNERFEEMTNASIINLSIEGGGPVPARFLTDYFLIDHESKNVLYMIDSFAFYSEQWNEVRIDDPELFSRAPFDWSLLYTMWKYPSTRGLIPGYLSGFYKINNQERFGSDLSDAEISKFTRTYRTNARVDERRIAFLYPESKNAETTDKYIAELESLARTLAERDINLVAIKTPLPQRVLEKLSGESVFDEKVRGALGRHGFELHDFTMVANDEAFFYDTDHLNRDGVINFMNTYLGNLLLLESQPAQY
jgi:hypothetical protein